MLDEMQMQQNGKRMSRELGCCGSEDAGYYVASVGG